MRRLSPTLPLFLVITAAGVAFLPQPANAVDAGSIDVSATVVALCNVVDVTDLAFGDYDPADVGGASAEAGFSVTCTTNAAVDVSLGAGGSPDGPQRRLSDGLGNFLKYDLYQDASGATPFGIGEIAQVSVSTAAATPVPVYGVIPAGEFVQTGNYNDSVVISLDF